MTKGLCITELNGSTENMGGFTMAKHYTPARRDAYVSAEGKRRALRQERTTARRFKMAARSTVKGMK